MAWNGSDGELREEIRKELMRTRSATYEIRMRMLRLAESIQHPEKGPRLVELVREIDNAFTLLERQLDR